MAEAGAFREWTRVHWMAGQYRLNFARFGLCRQLMTRTRPTIKPVTAKCRVQMFSCPQNRLLEGFVAIGWLQNGYPAKQIVNIVVCLSIRITTQWSQRPALMHRLLRSASGQCTSRSISREPAYLAGKFVAHVKICCRIKIIRFFLNYLV
jgi:hypothetical protein